MSNGQIKLAIGLPAYGGQLSAHHARMWLEVGNTLGASSERFRLVMFETIDVNPVDRARRSLVYVAAQHKADWLLMIDADTWVDVDSDSDAGFLLLRMISEADRAGAAVVSAPVYQRKVAEDDIAHLALYDDPANGHGRFLSSELSPMKEIYACGAAVMALNVPFAVKNELKFEFKYPDSEDLEFCRQVREAGGKIVVDSRIPTGHLGRQFPIYYGRSK